MSVFNTVSILKTSVGKHIKIDVYTFFLESIYEIVESVHALGVKVTCIGYSLASLKSVKVGNIPLGIKLMVTNEVYTVFCKSKSYLLGVFLVGKTRAAVEISSPETTDGAVLKLKMVANTLKKSVLARRLLVGINEAKVYRCVIIIRGKRNI